MRRGPGTALAAGEPVGSVARHVGYESASAFVAAFRRDRQALGWYRSATRASWLVAALFAPITTGVRYAVSRIG